MRILRTVITAIATFPIVAQVSGGILEISDDFSDGVVAPEVWVYGGALRGVLSEPNAWQWTVSEHDGFLQTRVWGPASANSHGAEVWIRTVHNYNDGSDHVVNFTWGADVNAWHLDNCAILIWNGVAYDGTNNQWFNDDTDGAKKLYVANGALSNPFGIGLQDTPPTSWSLHIDAVGQQAILFSAPDLGGNIIGHKSLVAGEPWYVGFIHGDATSAGFPNGDNSLFLYDFRSTSTTGGSPPPTSARPVIENISPVSARFGDVVTVSGQGFDPDPTRNGVWFGGVRTHPVSATVNELKVAVPIGAGYGYVQVTTAAGLSACSSKCFVPAFLCGSDLDLGSFSTVSEFAVGGFSSAPAIGDIDGDGKNDLVVANRYGKVSVFRNVGTGNAIQFGEQVDFQTGCDSFNVVLTDLDGDGRLDMIVPHAQGSVAVLRNASTPGSSNFEPAMLLASGGVSMIVAYGDFNLDGRADIVVANGDGSTGDVAVFQNLSVPGHLEFSPSVVFPTGTYPQWVSVGDLNGDGAPDIATANHWDNTVSVLLNNRVQGEICPNSFAPKKDYPVGERPLGLAIGDVDLDGDNDLVVGIYSGANLSVLPNLSADPGGVVGEFGAVVAFPYGGGIYGVTLADLNGDGKPDILAGCNNDPRRLVSMFQNDCSPGITASSFAHRVDLPANGEVQWVAVGDFDGDGRPDLVSSSWPSSVVAVYQNKMCAEAPDTTPPTITCPTEVDHNTDPGQCAAMVSFTVTAVDDRPGVTVICTPPSGSVFQKGNTAVMCVATDAAGNSATNSFPVIVQDREKPQLVIPADMTVPCHNALLVPVQFTVTASDNCDGQVSVECDPPPGSGFPIGTTVVHCVATDSSGNTSTGSFLVTRTPLVFDGFDEPIGGADTTGGSYTNPSRTFKLGNKIRISFELCGCGSASDNEPHRCCGERHGRQRGRSCSGHHVTTGVHTLKVVKWTSETDSEIPLDADSDDPRTDGNQFRLAGHKWVFVLDSRDTGMSRGKWQIVATLSDGSQHTAWIQLK